MILTGEKQNAPTETFPDAILYIKHLASTFLGPNSALSVERPATRRQKSDTAKSNMCRSVNACSLLESHRCFGQPFCSMFRIVERIFSRLEEHVPQYSWPFSTMSRNFTSRKTELHQKLYGSRFEFRTSEMWIRGSNCYTAAFDGSLKWSTKKEKPRRAGNWESL